MHGHDNKGLFKWSHLVGMHWRRQMDNWGGGRIFIYLCFAHWSRSRLDDLSNSLTIKISGTNSCLMFHEFLCFTHWALFNMSGDCIPIPSSVNEVKSKTWRPRDKKHQAIKALVFYSNGTPKSNILTWNHWAMYTNYFRLIVTHLLPPPICRQQHPNPPCFLLRRLFESVICRYINA